MGRFFYAVAALGIIAVLLFFPVYLETDAHYDMNRKKFTFILLLYRKLKVLGGYATTYDGGVALHLSKKKAALIDYWEMDKKRKKFSFARTFKIRSFLLTTETGAEYLLGVSAAHKLLRALFLAFGGEKERLRNNLWLSDGDVLRVSLQIVVFFNLFMLLKEFLKFLKEKIQILWRKKIRKSIV